MKMLKISKHGLPAEVMELVDIPKPDAPEAVGLSAAGNERSNQLMENYDARDRSKDFLGIWRSAANGIAYAATGKGQGAGPRDGRRRHAARLYGPVGWTPSSQGAAGARQRGRGSY